MQAIERWGDEFARASGTKVAVTTKMTGGYSSIYLGSIQKMAPLHLAQLIRFTSLWPSFGIVIAETDPLMCEPVPFLEVSGGGVSIIREWPEWRSVIDEAERLSNDEMGPN